MSPVCEQMIDGAPLKYSLLAHAVAELAETPR